MLKAVLDVLGYKDRYKKPIKRVIGSTIIDALAKWGSVREDTTYSYNKLRHTTTSITLFI